MKKGSNKWLELLIKDMDGLKKHEVFSESVSLLKRSDL